MGLISTTALAAHQIALQVTAILFMVPLGISMAATVRVGHAVGAGDLAGGQARRLCRDAISASRLVAVLTLAVIVGALCDRTVLPRRGARQATPPSSPLRDLLMVGATFFITDGMQTIAAGALRGMNDTRVPLLFAAISYWLIGFPAGLCAGLPYAARRRRRLDRPVARHAVYATLLVLRFRRLPADRQIRSDIDNDNECPRRLAPEVDRDALLAGAQFADAYRAAVSGAGLDARQAAEKMFARGPRWLEALFRLRTMLVAPFGLKASGANEPAPGGMIGLFPVLSETPERLVAGFDDSHLDFRIVVDVAPLASGQQVTLTTLVRTHNLLGRIYLTVILPFHRSWSRVLRSCGSGHLAGSAG